MNLDAVHIAHGGHGPIHDVEAEKKSSDVMVLKKALWQGRALMFPFNNNSRSASRTYHLPAAAQSSLAIEWCGGSLGNPASHSHSIQIRMSWRESLGPYQRGLEGLAFGHLGDPFSAYISFCWLSFSASRLTLNVVYALSVTILPLFRV